MKQLIAAVVLALCGIPSVRADLLTPTSYDEPNGSGQAHSGTFNYWDVSYSGSGSVTTDGASLTGGLGKLTDGAFSTQPWDFPGVSNLAGTGAFVGWTTSDPTLVFHFSGVTSYSEIAIHVDNSDTGGVAAPAQVLVSDGLVSNLYTIANPGFGDPFWITLNVSALGLSGNTIGLTLVRSEIWVFSDEIQFQGSRSVPEPSSLALVALGLIGVAGSLYRKRSRG